MDFLYGAAANVSNNKLLNAEALYAKLTDYLAVCVCWVVRPT